MGAETIIGDPATAIAQTARQQNVDLVAMATHGRGGIARLVMGSVATGVLHRIGVPLFLVRPARLEAAQETGLAAGAQPSSV